jgi:cbb3-type cytochrome oxidase subunit 1
MDWFIKAFIRASLLWFAAGIILGVSMAAHPAWVIYRPAHAHMTVVGFLTMLVFGVGYQLLPRLFGHPLHSHRLAIWHLFLANLGLGGMVTGFFFWPHSLSLGHAFTAGGGTLFTFGALFWVWNLWHTFNAADARARERAKSGRSVLPTAGGE